ncbi:hypothetical protein [Clostridium sp. ZBS15]|uniref:hypothetical protein n=1 Tax=Clostridium sp. ZBS15 TaxID=2949969 RepID=UPI00207AB5F8|nr:hypothetical protein [Clostridium sp. ZBS15]
MISDLRQIETLYNDMIKSDEYMLLEFNDSKMLIKIPDEGEFKFTLFHGTSRYMLDKFSKNGIIEFSKESKMDYQYALNILKCLNEISNKFEYNINPVTQLAIKNIDDRDRIDYTYKYMCLTTNIGNAQNYAEKCNKVGELNCAILNLYEDIRNNQGLDKIPQECIAYINELKKAEDSEGVILFVKNLDYNSICMNESEEKISFKNLLKGVITNKGYNIHYHGDNTLEVEIVPYSKTKEKCNEYLNDLKKQLEKYRVYPLRNVEFKTEAFKNKIKILKSEEYGFLM